MKALNREILRLALPSILANISIPLVGMVDMAVAGHLGGAAAVLIGALTVGSTLFDLLYWNFAFLRAGTGGSTAQAFGRGDKAEQAAIFIRAAITGLLAGLLLVAIQWPFLKLAFAVIHCTPEVRELATRYFMIRIWAAPAALSLMAFKGWFIGMQDSVSPMIADLLVLSVNAAASICLAFGVPALGIPAMGFDGIAAGTIFAQYTTLAFSILVVAFKYKKVFRDTDFEDVRRAFAPRAMKEFFSLNGDLLVRSLCFMVVYTGFTAISARYGDVLLASGALIMKIMMLFSFFTDGFAYAGEALTGRFIGEERREMVSNTIRNVFIWSMSIAALFMVMNACLSVPMFRIFTSDATVIEASSKFVPWIVLMPLLGCPAFTWDGIYVGATLTRPLRNSSLLFVVISVIVWIAGISIMNSSFGLPSLSFGPDPGPGEPGHYGFMAMHVLFIAYMVHLLVRCIYLTVYWRRRRM